MIVDKGKLINLIGACSQTCGGKKGMVLHKKMRNREFEAILTLALHTSSVVNMNSSPEGGAFAREFLDDEAAADLTNVLLAHLFEIKGYKIDPGPSLFSEFQSRGLQANFPAQVLDALGEVSENSMLREIGELITGEERLNGLAVENKSEMEKEVRVFDPGGETGIDGEIDRVSAEEERTKEKEVVSSITLTLSSVPNKELKKNSLARLLSSSYGAIGKLADADNEHPLKQNQALNAAIRGLYRIGTVFSHLLTPPLTDQADDNTILVLLGVFWALWEKLFRSAHMENGSLSAAACHSLSQAIHSSSMELPSIQIVSENQFMMDRAQLSEEAMREVRRSVWVFNPGGGVAVAEAHSVSIVASPVLKLIEWTEEGDTAFTLTTKMGASFTGES